MGRLLHQVVVPVIAARLHVHVDGRPLQALHDPLIWSDELASTLFIWLSMLGAVLALDRGEIGIVFQPQYPVDSEQISGVEALARWNHPQYGPLGAGILFATAERSDYMLPLSAHIQNEALRQAARAYVPTEPGNLG